MLFAFWDTLRGERAAPDRGEIQPGEMRHILADTFILEADREAGPVFRLAGTRVCALFGRELKDVPFEAVWETAERTESRNLVRTVAADTIGLVAGLVGTNANGSQVALEMVILPLRHRGRTQSRLLGCLSPATIPSWAGLVPLTSLSTRSVRIIQAATRSAAGEPPVRRSIPQRRLFVIHEGGRR